MKEFDNLGDLCKFFEKQETQRICLPGLPVYARLDGRGFSKYTKSFKRPYDEEMSSTMICLMHYLVDEFDATCGYTQSDEISIGWVGKPIIFDGKIQKLVSSLAASASAWFARSKIAQEKPEIPTFDCRLFQLPNEELCMKQFLWREFDCTKNAITMAAGEYYSHNELLGKNGSEKQEMLFAKGVNFNDYPQFFKSGTYCLRKKSFKELDPEVLAKIPEHKRPTGPVERNYLIDCSFQLSKIENKLGTLFHGEDIRYIK